MHQRLRNSKAWTAYSSRYPVVGRLADGWSRFRSWALKDSVETEVAVKEEEAVVDQLKNIRSRQLEPTLQRSND